MEFIMQKSTFFHKSLLMATLVAMGMPTFNYAVRFGQQAPQQNQQAQGQQANPQPQGPNLLPDLNFVRNLNDHDRAELARVANVVAGEMAAQRQAIGNIIGQTAGAGIDGFNQAAQDPAVAAGITNLIGNIANGAANGLNNPQIGQGLNNLIGNLATGAANGLDNPEIDRAFQNFGKPWANGGEAAIAFNNIGNVFSNLQFKLLIKPLAQAAAITILGAGGTAGCYYGAKALIEEWQRNRKRPQIIIETSYKTLWQRLKGAFSFGKKEEIKMIFPADVQARLDEIAKATKNINQRINEGKTNVKYRNVLLYGKPGTGKTMFARKLAHECGMEFAMMSGSSFTKQGALEEMDHLFKWANNSKGIMLFIDEAESFLLKRETMKTDSYEYKVLTNFLNYTGTRSGKCMIVMATNRLSQIDSAIYRRVDDLVEIPLPQQEERTRVLKLYRDKVLMDTKQNGEEFVNSAKRHMTDAKVQEMATATQGLSNGDLEGIINSIKTSSDITSSGLVAAQIVDTAVQRYMQKQREFENAAKSITA